MTDKPQESAAVPHLFRWSALVFVVTFILYLATLSQGFPPGHDSAEFIAAAAVKGIAHPPGYPLYTALGSLSTDLGHWLGQSPAYCMNILAALGGSAACALLCATVGNFTGSLSAGLVAGLTLGVARTPWRLAVGAEVFSLHLALCALLFWICSLRRLFPHKAKTLMSAGCFVLSLGLSHHHTIILLIPGIILFLGLTAASEERKLNPQSCTHWSWNWGWSVWQWPCLLGGLLPYFWLPWRASQHPALNWGNPDNAQRFLWVVTRSGYGSLSLNTQSDSKGTIYHLAGWLKSLALYQFPLVGALSVLYISLATWIKKEFRDFKPEVSLFLVTLLITGPLWCFIASQPTGEGYTDVMERFFATSYLCAAALLGLAWSAVAVRPAFPRTGRVIAALLLLVPALVINFPACNQRGEDLTQRTYELMSQVIPDDALVVTGSDLTSGLLLYATSAGERHFTHIPAGLAASPWFMETLPPEYTYVMKQAGLPALMLWARRQGKEVYCDFTYPNMPGYFVPCGTLYKYLAPEEKGDKTSLYRQTVAMLEKDEAGRAPLRVRTNRPFWENFLVRARARIYYVCSLQLASSQPAQAAELKAKALFMEPELAKFPPVP